MRLPVTRGVDSGFAALIYDWARGRDLRQVLQPGAGPGRGGRKAAPAHVGRRLRPQRQTGHRPAPPGGDGGREPDTAHSARVAAERLLRDVVAASSVVTIPVEHGTIRAGRQPAP